MTPGDLGLDLFRVLEGGDYLLADDSDAIEYIARRLHELGWRHVVAADPGPALDLLHRFYDAHCACRTDEGDAGLRVQRTAPDDLRVSSTRGGSVNADELAAAARKAWLQGVKEYGGDNPYGTFSDAYEDGFADGYGALLTELDRARAALQTVFNAWHNSSTMEAFLDAMRNAEAAFLAGSVQEETR